MTTGLPRVAAIVATYRPDTAMLGDLVAAVAPQVSVLWIVDDGTPADEAADFLSAFVAWQTIWPHLHLARDGVNRGQAEAINRGLQLAGEAHASHCLLLDQDSLPAEDLVDILIAAEARLIATGLPVAAVGPRLKTANGAFLPVQGCCQPEDEVLPGLFRERFLITSGTLIRAAAMEAIGSMAADFFIDNVDLEWCFRAQAKGFKLFSAEAASLVQRIGERAPVFGGLFEITRHSPDRLYYMTRNRVRLQLCSYAPWSWRLRDLARLIGKFTLFTLGVPPRMENCRALLHGVVDGLRRRAGPRPR